MSSRWNLIIDCPQWAKGGTMAKRTWIQVLLSIGISLGACGLASAGEKEKRLSKEALIQRLDLKPADRVKDDVDDICLRRRLLKRRYAPEVHYAPPETYGPTVDPQYVPPSSAKPSDPPRAPARTETPTLPAPGVPMTFPYDGGPVRSMPRTLP